MRSRLFGLAASLAVAATSAVVFAAPSPAMAHCDSGHNTHPDLYSAGGIDYQTSANNGTKIKDKPHRRCVNLGIGYRRHGIDVHCAVWYPRVRRLWIFNRDTTTGKRGWSRWGDLYHPRDYYEIPTCNQAASTTLAVTPSTVTVKS